MSNQFRFVRWYTTALVAALVASCGGGGASGGIDRLGISASSGTITGFGSVIVNGVAWDTSGATIRSDDAAAIESDLRVGQVVIITGDVDSSGLTGDADTVEYDSSLEGPIGTISLSTDTFTVLNQTVRVTLSTAFDDSIPNRVADGQRTLADLLPADVVEVSGFRDSTGIVQATRVEIRSGSEDFEVRGVVTNLNAVTQTFTIGSLTVDFDGATQEGFGGATLANNQIVEVEGDLTGGILVANKVELEDNLPGEDGDSGEVEGLITRFASATDFDVNGVRVTTTGSTEYERGVVGDLALNAKVEAEGDFNAGGVLVADKIEFRVSADEEDVEIAGNVAAVNAAAGTLTIEGTTILVRVNAGTRLEDQSNADITDFSLADLSVGNYVEIRGATDSETPGVANDVIATRLEREDADPDNDFILQGPVQSINNPELVILGVTINADTATEYLDFSDIPFDTIDDFFDGFIEGDVVKAKSALDAVFGDDMDPDELEIEDFN